MLEYKLQDKQLILGTALWGSGIEKKQAFELLDCFVERGGRVIDSATNYPINNQIHDYGLALSWVKQWIEQNPSTAISIIAKIGALRNDGNAEIDLSKTNILRVSQRLISELGTNLGCISIHWDNRSEAESLSIFETVSALGELKSQGIEIGFSGISTPRLYYQANPSHAENWLIQCKENFLTNTARKKYSTVFPKARYLAYGINMGGVKFSSPNQTSSVSIRQIATPEALLKALIIMAQDDLFSQYGLVSISDFSLLSTYANPSLHGVIIGSRNTNQLDETLRLWQFFSQMQEQEIQTLNDKIQSTISSAYDRIR